MYTITVSKPIMIGKIPLCYISDVLSYNLGYGDWTEIKTKSLVISIPTSIIIAISKEV